jgi:hypothetical protein
MPADRRQTITSSPKVTLMDPFALSTGLLILLPAPKLTMRLQAPLPAAGAHPFEARACGRS